MDLILDDPPSLADGEITDMGYLNQRAALDRRAPLAEFLYADPAASPVILPTSD